MELNVLGPLQMVESGQPLPVGGIKQRTVLALLIAAGGRPVSTDALIYGVYGDEAPDGARRSVQTYVSTLRRQLGDYLGPTGSGYQLTIDRSAVDAYAFEDAVLADGDSEDPGTRADRLRNALATWRGLAYADVDAYDVIPGEISRLTELRLVAVEALIDADLASGRHAELVGQLESLTAQHPHRERLRGQQMLALYRAGRQADALRAFEAARTYLVEEMGLDPSAELRMLERQILDQDPALGHAPRPTLRRATVLVSDVGDPSLLSELDPAERARSIDLTSGVLIHAINDQGGEVFAQRGTAVYAWFDDASAAAEAAESAQWALAESGDEALRLRMAMDSGDVEVSGLAKVQGPPVSRAAALLAVSQGGQVLLAPGAHRDLAAVAGDWQIRGLGSPEIDGIETGSPIHQLQGSWPGGRDGRLRAQGLVPPPPDRRTSLPGYEFREVAGSGQFGVVHKAYQPSVGREVAVKEIRADLVDHPLFIRRFEVEARLVARLEHPHIVPLYDFWRDSSGAFLVTRWMSGGSLRDRLVPGGLTESDVSKMVSQVGAALAAAHRGGVTHRDIRPENILFDSGGNAYLSDFAIASVDLPEGSRGIDVGALANTLRDCFELTSIPLEPGVRRLLETAGNGSMGVEPFLAEWDTVVGDTALAAATLSDARNPYKGLDAFSEHDAADFHGRDTLIDHLVDAVRGRRLVAVTGPSGIGKSSVVRAGLIPALRRGAIGRGDRWLITDMVPSAHPFEQLASALERVAVRTPLDFEEQLRRDERSLLRATQRYLPQEDELLLVVDQFEELFTVTEDDAVRAAFMALLAETAADARSRVRIVLTLRADFFDHPLSHPEFGELLRTGTVPVSAPTEEELVSIIESPAEAVRVSYEAGLVDRIVEEVSGQPGTLPLVEFALTRLFDGRTSDEIPSGDYQRLGGVLRALGQQAEQTYATLNSSQREIAKQVFVRLVNVTEGGHVTRRRVNTAELARLGYTPAELGAVVDALVGARLLTSDRDAVRRLPTLEVAHEALLSEWSRLQDWIRERQEDLLLHSRLAAAVADWEAADRSTTYLLESGRLDQHESWTADTDLALTTTENEYLHRSREAISQQARGRRKIRRRVLAGFAAAAILASILAVIVLVARNNAAAQAEVAESERLLAHASAVIDDDPQLALLLAVAAVGDDPIRSTHVGLLREAMAADKAIMQFEWHNASVGETRADISPDGSVVVVGADPASRVVALEVPSGREIWRYQGRGGIGGTTSTAPRFVSGGSEVLVSVEPTGPAEPESESVGLFVLDAVTGQLNRSIDTGTCGAAIADANDSYALIREPSAAHIEAFGCGAGDTGFVSYDVAVVDLASGDRVSLTTDAPDLFGEFLGSLSADGAVAAVDAQLNEPYVFDTSTGRVIRRMPQELTSAVALSPDGASVVLGGGESAGGHALFIRQTASNEVVSTIAAHPGGTAGVVFSTDGSRVATAGSDGAVRVWDPIDGSLMSEVRVGSEAKLRVQLSQDGGRLVISGSGPEVHVASLRPADSAEIAAFSFCDMPTAFYQAYSLDIREGLGSIAVACGDQLVGQVFDTTSGELVGESQPTWGLGVDLAPDGRSIATQRSWTDEDDEWWYGPLEIKSLETGDITTLGGLCEFRWDDLEPVGCAQFPEPPFSLANTSLGYSPDGRLIAAVEEYASFGGVWDVSTGQLVHTFRGQAFAFSPDSASLMIVNGAEVQLRQLDTFDVVASRTLDARDEGWSNLVFSPDGSLVVGSPFNDEGSGDLLILDATTLDEVRRIVTPHDGSVRHIALSTDGSLAATAGTDGYAGVWDLASGESVMHIPVATDDRVQVVGFVDNDSRLMAAPLHGPLMTYSLDPSEVLQVARVEARRGFTTLECATYFDRGECPTIEAIQSGS